MNEPTLSPEGERFVHAALGISRLAHDLEPGIGHNFGFVFLEALHGKPDDAIATAIGSLGTNTITSADALIRRLGGSDA